MSKEIATALAAPFDAKDLKQRPGRAGLVFTYADARAVAQRLDDVLGLAGWQFEVKVADPDRSVVHGSLAIVVDGKTSIREDFGYPNSAQDDEPLKSAASDALRRCAAQIGVGRSLYSPERGQAPARAAAPATGPQTGKPAALRGFTDDDLIAAKAAMIFAENASDGACSHGEAWSLKPGGISKASGKPYNPFWAASHKAPDGSWCKEKPSIKWIASQKAEPTPTKLVPEDDLEALPF
jgi:hypothetical protein